MSPFLTTLGGGSVRGFGRGRRIIGVTLPIVTITSVTSDTGGNATINWTTNKTSEYDTYLYFGGNNGATYYYVSTTGSHQTYIGLCVTTTYQVKLRNKITGIFEAQSDIVTYTTNSAAYGTVQSSYCSGCTEVFTKSNGICGGSYTENESNSWQCCPPAEMDGGVNQGGYYNYGVSMLTGTSYSWTLDFSLNNDDAGCGQGYLISGFGTYGTTIGGPGFCAGRPGTYVNVGTLTVFGPGGKTATIGQTSGNWQDYYP